MSIVSRYYSGEDAISHVLHSFQFLCAKKYAKNRMYTEYTNEFEKKRADSPTLFIQEKVTSLRVFLRFKGDSTDRAFRIPSFIPS